MRLVAIVRGDEQSLKLQFCGERWKFRWNGYQLLQLVILRYIIRCNSVSSPDEGEFLIAETVSLYETTFH
jgi:hypothetical protein